MLLLIRHGQTHLNAQRRFMGTTDAPLDDTGREQAQALGRSLTGEIDALYTSPLLRARQTAQPLGQAIVEPRLAELDQGRLEGMLAQEAMLQFPDFFARWQADPTTAEVPGGESLGACLERARAAVRDIVGRHASDTRIGIVSHQLVISALLCWAADRPLRDWRTFAVGNGTVSTITSLDPPAVGIAGWVPSEDEPLPR